ncbi:MAG: hypothetical protein Q9228_004055, partial [Teloschistes exilis]
MSNQSWQSVPYTPIQRRQFQSPQTSEAPQLPPPSPSLPSLNNQNPPTFFNVYTGPVGSYTRPETCSTFPPSRSPNPQQTQPSPTFTPVATTPVTTIAPAATAPVYPAPSYPSTQQANSYPFAFGHSPHVYYTPYMAPEPAMASPNNAAPAQ